MHLKSLKSISLSSRLIALLAVSAITTVYILAYTATGISWILNANLNDSKARISIEEVSREFGGNTTVRNLKYHSDSTDIVFDSIKLQWNPLSIFSSQIFIESLTGQNLSVNIKTDHDESPSPIALIFPIATKVLSAHIKNLKINANGKVIYAVNEADIDNIYLENSFFAEKITLKSSENKWLTLSGRFGFAANSVINLTTESMFALPGKNGSLRAKGTVVGNAVQMRFLQHVDLPIAAKITGRVRNLFTNPSWVIDSRIRDTNILAKSSSLSINNLEGTISFIGNVKDFQLVSNVSFRDDATTNWLAKLDAKSNKGSVNFKVAVANQEPELQSRANFSGTYNLNSLQDASQITNSLKFKGDWKNIKLALFKNNLIASKSGKVEFNGELFSTHLTANDLQLEKMGSVISSLKMDTKNVSQSELAFKGNASASGGNLKLTGRMTKKYNKYKLNSLFLSGRNFPLVRNPNAHIIISPDVSFVRKNETMTSRGTVEIPTANIQLQDFQKTLSQLTSIIASDKTQLKSAGSVDVKFGKSVWMHGYGLNANVTGDLSLKDLSNKKIIAHGILKVVRGQYRNRREDHKLTSGRLKFYNHDIDNPELELRLVENESSQNSTSKITGRLQQLFTGSKQKSRKEAFDRKTKSTTSKENVAFNSLR